MARKTKVEVEITGDADGLKKASGQAEKALSGIEDAAGKAGKGLDQSLGAAGKKLTGAVTVPLLAVGAAAVATAVDFDNTFGQIEGLVGISGDALTDLKDKTLALAPAVGIGPGDLAKGLYFLTSAGLDAAQSMDTLEASSKAAAASGAQVETVADAAASAVNAYAKEGLTGRAAVDILTAGVKFGKTEFEGFSAAVGAVIPIASAAGVEFDEVTAAMSALSLTGSDAAEAGTQVRAFIQAIIKPSKEAATALGMVGLSTDELRRSLAEDGLLATMRLLKSRFGDNTEAMATWAGRVEGFNAILGVTNNEASKIDAIFEGVAHSTGSADEAFAAISKTAGFKAKTALASLQVAAVDAGGAILPVLANVGDAVAGVANGFAGLDPEVQQAIVVIGGVTAAAGPAASALGKLTGMVKALSAEQALATGLFGLTAAVAAGGFIAMAQESATARHRQEDLYEALVEAGDQALIANTRNIDLAKSLAVLAQESGDAAAKIEDASPATAILEQVRELEKSGNFLTSFARKVGLEDSPHLVDALNDAGVSIEKFGSNAKDTAGSSKKLADEWLNLQEQGKRGRIAYDDLTQGQRVFMTAVQQGLDAGRISNKQATELVRAFDDLSASYKGITAGEQRKAQAAIEDAVATGRLTEAMVAQAEASTAGEQGVVDYVAALDLLTAAKGLDDSDVKRFTNMATATSNAADEAEVFTGVLDRQAPVVEDVAKALEEITKQTSGYLKAVFGVKNAEGQYIETLNNLTTTVVENAKEHDNLTKSVADAAKSGDTYGVVLGNLKLQQLGAADSMDINTTAGRNNRKAIQDTVTATADLIDAKRNDGASEADLTKIREDAKKRVDDLAASIGLNKDEVNYLTTSLQNLPVNTVANVQVNANTEEALRKIDAVFARLEVTAAAARASGIDAEGIVGARAEGGPVKAGSPYLVGEKGPELIVPKSAGMVIPHDVTAAMSAAGKTSVYARGLHDPGPTEHRAELWNSGSLAKQGGVTVNVNMSGVIASNKTEIVRWIREALRQLERSGR